MRTARGCEVTITGDGRTRQLRPRFDLRRHSHEFEWGYAGSGPAQLALALAADALGDDARARDIYQRLKSRVVSRLAGDSWTLTEEDIRATAVAIECHRAEARRGEEAAALQGDDPALPSAASPTPQEAPMARARKKKTEPTPPAEVPDTTPPPPAAPESAASEPVTAGEPSAATPPHPVDPTPPTGEPGPTEATSLARPNGFPTDPHEIGVIALGAASDAPRMRLFRSQRYSQMRMQFDEKPDEAYRVRLHEAGWRWRPAEGVWTIQLDPGQKWRGHAAAERLFDEIGDAIRADRGCPPGRGVLR
ncbi:MAG TPA: DUF6166 domain-containing protein [Urbifossiella sp.]|nr:DUF6166 domain-containing protein [Urbifossiella sp.]